MKHNHETPETLLKALRRLPQNMICPNCGTHAPAGIGFGSICMKFKTFVCDLCKTSHQAISHRVKSISMSTWTLDEVYSLEDKNCGGNEACRFIWLNKAPSYGGRYTTGQRPKTGDRIEIFKQFVVDCYESGMFKATQPYISENRNIIVTNNIQQQSVPNSKPYTRKVETDLLGWDDPSPSTSQPFGSKNISKPETDLLGWNDNPLPSSTTQGKSYTNGDFADFSNINNGNTANMSNSSITTNAPSKSSDFLDLLSNIDAGSNLTNNTCMPASNGLSKYIDPFASTSTPMLAPNNFGPMFAPTNNVTFSSIFPQNNAMNIPQQPQLAQPYNTMNRGNMMNQQQQQSYGTPYWPPGINQSSIPMPQNNNMINTQTLHMSKNNIMMSNNSSSFLQQHQNKNSSSNDVFGFISQELKSSVYQKK